MQNAIFLTTSEAAERLRLSARTLERMRLFGSGPPFRAHGRRILYSAADLEAWSASRSTCSTAERDAAKAADR
ncbi:MAG: helix-turn-helix domain-containing protein [Alphaproteobacteria bacterium]|nr:helix-turn-helix domain-containing protein [Alphaproteobacteria bacterium]